MSDKLLAVNIVSQEGSVYEADAKMVSLRGSEGEMGITYGHTQLISTLPPGVIRIEKITDNQRDTLYISGGILEVQPCQVTILSDVMERANNIDEISANKARKKAKEVLQQAEGKVDVEEARQMLMEAEARLKAIKILKGINSYHNDSEE